jgi:uncharacterized membrane protein
MVSTGMPVEIEVTVNNSGALASREKTLNLTTGKDKYSISLAPVQPNEQKKSVFNVSFKQSGETGCSISIDNNMNPMCRTWFFTLKIRERIYVLLVNSQKSRLKTQRDTFFSALALAPEASYSDSNISNKAESGGDGKVKDQFQDQFQEQIIVIDSNADDLKNYELTKFDVIIFNDPGKISLNSVDKLRSYLLEGGGVIITGGPKFYDFIERDNKAALQESGLADLLPGKPLNLISSASDSPVGLNMDVFKESHPLLGLFTKNDYSLLKAPEFNKAIVISINNLDPDIKVIAGFDDQTPALAEKITGLGRLLFFTSSFDLKWGNLPVASGFVPLIHQMTRYLCQSSSGPGSIICGTPFDTTLSLKSLKQVLNLTSPSGTRKDISFQTGSEFYTSRIESTWEHGIYKIVKDSGEKITETLVAANPDPNEWTFEKIKLPGIDQKNREQSFSAAPEYRYELWNYFLFLILLLSIFELLAGSRIKKASAPEKSGYIKNKGLSILFMFFYGFLIFTAASGPLFSAQGVALSADSLALSADSLALSADAASPGLSANDFSSPGLSANDFSSPGLSAANISPRDMSLNDFEIIFEKIDFFSIIIVLVTAGISFFIYKKSASQIDKTRFIILVSLRTALLVLILLMLFKPSALMRYTVRQPGVTGIIFDTSDSMGLKDGTDQKALFSTRLDQAKKAVTGDFIDSLLEKGEIRYFSAASALDELQAREIENLFPDRGYTNLGKAVLDASKNLSFGQVSALILFSDGNSNFGPDPVLMSKLSGVMVHTIGVGKSSLAMDIGIQSVGVNAQAYVDVPLKIKVKIVSSGFMNMKIPVQLMAGPVQKARKFIDIKTGLNEAEFYYTPKTPGIKHMSVYVEAQDGELLTNNNSRDFLFNAVEARTRVLLLGGQPSFDYKFLRLALIRDESVILSAALAKDNKKLHKQPDSNEIIWPVKNSSDLDRYDVIIYTDPLEDIINPKHLQAFLEKGRGIFFAGSLKSIKGNRDFETMLPLYYDKERKIDWFDLDFKFFLTPQGENHEAVKLVPGKRANSFIWTDWPELRGFAPLKAKPGAKTLISGRPRNEKEFPLFAVQRFGKGRTACFAASGIWRMSFQTGVSQTELPALEDDMFIRFISNVTKWCRPLENRSRLWIKSDKYHYIAGDRISLQARVYDENSMPLEGGFVRVSLYRVKNSMTPENLLDTDKFSLQDSSEVQPLVLNRILSSDKDSVYTGDLVPRGTGTFVIQAQSSDDPSFKDIHFKARTLVLVRTPAEEFIRLNRNVQALKNIALASGGEYRDIQACSEILPLIEDKSKTFELVKNRPLWDSWWAYFIFLALLGVEWIIRKREGLR